MSELIFSRSAPTHAYWAGVLRDEASLPGIDLEMPQDPFGVEVTSVSEDHDPTILDVNAKINQQDALGFLLPSQFAVDEGSLKLTRKSEETISEAAGAVCPIEPTKKKPPIVTFGTVLENVILYDYELDLRKKKHRVLGHRNLFHQQNPYETGDYLAKMLRNLKGAHELQITSLAEKTGLGVLLREVCEVEQVPVVKVTFVNLDQEASHKTTPRVVDAEISVNMRGAL